MNFFWSAFALCCAFAWQFTCGAQSPPALPPITGVLAHVPGGNTSGGEVRERHPRSDGYWHIDTPRTISRLKQLHANTCNYTIWGSPTDWDDLRNELLPAAQKAGLKVWVYLVPPAESGKKSSYPFKTDYVAWARAIAELSVRYPALQAWQMDDFTWATKDFPPQKVAQLQSVAHGINPKLRFFVVAIPTAITEQFMTDYGPVIDGVVAPYFDAPFADNQRTSSLDAQINAAHNLLKIQNKALYLLIYVGRRFHSPLEPTPEYVASAMDICTRAMCEGRLEGIVSYGTPIDEGVALTRNNPALDGNGRLNLAHPVCKTTTGDWAAASQTIHIDSKAPRKWLSFWHRADWEHGDPPGALVQEVLIEDTVVWRLDPARGLRNFWHEGNTLEGAIDLTEILKGKSTARLTVRLRTTKTFTAPSIDVSFDRFRATGFSLIDPGFETGEGWKIGDNGGGLMAARDQFDPHAPRKLFQAVRHSFAAFHK